MELSPLYAAHIAAMKERYRAALQEHGAEEALVYSGTEHVVFQDDHAYPFRANHHFKNWVPLTRHPECFVLLGSDNTLDLIYYQPEDYWHVTPAAPNGFWTEQFNIHIVREPQQARSVLRDDLSGLVLIGEESDLTRAWDIGRINPPEIITALHYERAYKTDYEVECIAQANRIAVRGHLAARDTFHSGASELDIHLAYLAASKLAETELPYNNIIALNEHGAVLHYDVYDTKPPKDHRSFLIDAGASFNGYASDITRTYAGGNGDFDELIDAVEQAQLELIGEIRAGGSYIDLHRHMHRQVAAILRRLDVVTMAPDDMVETNVTGYFFPHGLGHHLGVMVHDAGAKLANRAGETISQPEHDPYLRNLRPIEVGNVFTIEPGIYFVDLLLENLRNSPHRSAVNWDRIDALHPYGGVRIEDDIHVGKDGLRNLTREAFAAST